MKNANYTSAVVTGCLVVMSAVAALAQDWPQWRGPNRDAKATRFNAPNTWPKELTQKWKVAVGTGDATPALVGERLYVFARQEKREVAMCLDAATGKEVWREGYESGDATGAAARHSGPRSSPAVADGKMVAYGVRGALSCFDAGTGKVIWRKETTGSVPRFFTSASPILVDGMCIAQLGGEDNGTIAAYDLAAGDEKWKWTEDGTAYASPALATVDGTKLLVTLTAKRIVALSLEDGKLLWEAPFAVPPGSRAYNAATPLVDGTTVIYGGGGRGAKAVKFEKKDGRLSGTELWSNPDNAVQFNTPVLKNGLIFGLSQGGDLFCMNARDGQTAWKTATGARGGFGSIVDAGSVLMALTPEAELIVFAPNDKEYQKLASYKVAPSDVYAYPVASGNRIFIKDKDSLTLWTVE